MAKKQEHALFVVQRVSILRNKYHQPDIFSGNYVAKGDLKLMSVECVVILFNQSRQTKKQHRGTVLPAINHKYWF